MFKIGGIFPADSFYLNYLFRRVVRGPLLLPSKSRFNFLKEHGRFKRLDNIISGSQG
jgi:hypothetical protein